MTTSANKMENSCLTTVSPSKRKQGENIPLEKNTGACSGTESYSQQVCEERHKDINSSGWVSSKEKKPASNHGAESRKGRREVVTGDCHV